jgi:hypothetical protein
MKEKKHVRKKKMVSEDIDIEPLKSASDKLCRSN